MKLMKAIQVSLPGADFELIEKEIPEPGNNEVLIKVEACGVCHGYSIAKERHFPEINIRLFRGMKW
jgi:D-arabinose 1-dehydrogenase-like Zn-dependent alcohol dehydrogenase